MSKPLSYSGYGRYMTCPKQFDYHYNERIRPNFEPSHLIFGSAIDNALNALLLETGSPLEECEKVLTQLLTKPVLFNKADYDGELIDAPTKALLLEACVSFGYKGDDVDLLVDSLLSQDWSRLSPKQRACLALCCTASLRAKAALFIKAYKARVSPRLRKIQSVQTEIKWTDHNGNDFVGLLDLEAEIEGEDGIFVLDNKTAARPYANDAVIGSAQLALYSAKRGTQKAGFIVLNKQIKKNRIKTCTICGHVAKGRHATCEKETVDEGRCGGVWAETIQPEVEIQFLTADIPKHVQDITVEAMSEAAKAIQAGHFPRNLNACGKQYGKPCPYIGLCWRKDMTGLEVKPEEAARESETESTD